MKASEALDVLVDPANLVADPGHRARGGAGAPGRRLASPRRPTSRRRPWSAALADAAAIGLPPEAKGNPEGYLFPATYTVPPDRTPSA